MGAFFDIDTFFLFVTLLASGLTQEACQNPRNQTGTCISIRNCEELLDILRNQRDNPEAVAFLQQSQCGYDNGPLVCCPGRPEVPKTQLPEPPNCGYSNVTHTKVVGGSIAERGAWPWMAALGYRPKSTSTSQKPLFLCGGSLITTKHVLTAAHCVHNSPSLYMVRVGDLDLASDTDDQYAVNILITEKIVYEKYDKSTHLGDIALLKLQEAVPQTQYIQPVCMPLSSDLRSKKSSGIFLSWLDGDQQVTIIMNTTDENGIHVVFGLLDYSLFGLTLLMSALIGVYFAFYDPKRENTRNGYLMGSRSMGIFPISMSLIASYISGISLLALPAEMYVYGTQYWLAVLSEVPGSFTMSFVYLPVFHRLKIMSSYEYLELRFNKAVRLFGSILFIVKMLLYIPIVVYVPALAFSQVTGFNLHLITPIVCIVCIFYTMLGGLKAVVWTDTLQTIARALISQINGAPKLDAPFIARLLCWLGATWVLPR